MKFSASNIALTPYQHEAELQALSKMGLDGLEVAPSRVWKDTWKGLTVTDVASYRRKVESANLKIVGLHSLFYDHPDLSMFGDKETRDKTLEFMIHLSKLCRDLGGQTLIYGGGRQRGDVPLEDAFRRCVDFCGELCVQIEDHGTSYCFEPLGPQKIDFINSVYDSLRIVESVNRPSLRIQLDAEALSDNNEINEDVFAAAKPYLVHVHANEPGFAVLGSSGKVDHSAIGRHLKTIGYNGYVSIEQRMLNEGAPLVDLENSVSVLKNCYA